MEPPTAPRTKLGAAGRALGGALATALGTVLLLPLAFPGVSWWLRSRLPFSVNEPMPADGHGTLWLYWWVAEALARDVDVLRPDVACAPGAAALGLAFPNRVDALLAAPFVRLLPFPLSINVAVFSGVVLAAIGAGLLFGRLVRFAPIAWVLAAVYALNLYTANEIRMGRPVTAFIAWIPLFLWAWLAALDAPRRAWAWAVLAGVLGAVAAHAYVPFAVFLLFAGLAMAAVRAAVPAPGVGRARPLLVGVVTAAVGVLLVAPYYHELTVVRPRLGAGALARPFWDPALWRELAEVRLPEVRRDGADGPPRWADVQDDALPWDYLWLPRFGRVGFVGLPGFFVLVAAGLGLLGGPRGWAWLAGAAVAWLVTLGPNLSERSGAELQWLLVAGRRIALPVSWILDAWPEAARWLRPVRAFPFVLLGLGAAAATGLDRIAASRSWARWVALAGAVALVVGTLWMIRPRGVKPERLSLSPFLAEMAADPEPYAVVELPVGLEHGGGAYQIVHGKRRADGVQGLRPDGPPPSGCYALPFLEAMWALGDGPPSAAVRDGLAPAALAEARAAGFRYVIWYRRARPLGAVRVVSEEAVRAALSPALGPPVAVDAMLIAWAIPDAPGSSAGPAPEAGAPPAAP